MGFSLSVKAEEDIIDIFRAGAEQFGLYQAERYHERLERCFPPPVFPCLGDNPLAARERVEINPAVRIHPVEAHLLVYRVDENGGVFIIRVRHGHEDWQASADIEPVE